MKISVQNEPVLSIQECFEKFIRTCKNKNLSKDTISFYQNTFHIFEMYCETNVPVT